MTRTDVLIDFGIVIGSYAIVSLVEFVWKLIEAPAKLDYEKTQVIEAAQKVIGVPGSVMRDVFDTCADIHDFIRDFSIQYGPLPIPTLTPDAEKKLQMDRDQATWGYKFTAAFHSEFDARLEQLLHRLAAEGQCDWAVSDELKRTPFYPEYALNVVGLLVKMAMRLRR